MLRLEGNNNLELVQVLKFLGGTLKDSYLDSGFLLEKEISFGGPQSLNNANVLLANTPMDFDRVKIFGTKVKTQNMEQLAEIEEAEKRKMARKVEKILKFGADVFINRQLIYDYPEQLLTQAGVMVIEHADFEGIERL